MAKMELSATGKENAEIHVLEFRTGVLGFNMVKMEGNAFYLHDGSGHRGASQRSGKAQAGAGPA